jgi:hypothetical protein
VEVETSFLKRVSGKTVRISKGFHRRQQKLSSLDTIPLSILYVNCLNFTAPRNPGSCASPMRTPNSSNSILEYLFFIGGQRPDILCGILKTSNCAKSKCFLAV